MPSVGSISVGLNCDLVQFASGLEKATAMARAGVGNMSAEMKRQNREGAESFRLISESLDLHVSRPLSRIVAQIPGVGSALASLGGIGLGGAGLFALGSFVIDKLGPAFEHLKGQVTGWDETAQKAYKDQIALNDQFVRELDRHKEKLLEISHIGLGGSSLIKQLQIENTAAIAAQTKAMADAQAKINSLRSGIAAGPFGESLTGKAEGNIPEIKSKITDAQAAMDKMSLTMKELQDRGAELTAQLGMVGAQEAEKRLTEAIHAQAEERKKMWEQENKYWEQVERFARDYEKALAAVNAEALKLSSQRYAQLAGGMTSMTVAPPSGAPMLKDQAELAKIQNDANESWKEAGEVLQSIETPLQKYDEQLQVLDELLMQGRLTQDQFTLAQIKAQEEMDKALHKQHDWSEYLREMGDAHKQLTDTMQKGFSGLTDNMAQMLATGKANWHSFLTGMEEDLLRLVTNKIFSMLLGSIFPAGGTFANWFQGRAGGGDLTPGQNYLVGEAGPELVSVGSSGGIVAPNASLVGGGRGDTNYIIDARGADAGVEQRIMRAIRLSENRAVARAMSGAAEFQKRTVS